MKIGIATAYIDKSDGGIWTYTHNLVKQLESMPGEQTACMVDREERKIFSSNNGKIASHVFSFPAMLGSRLIWPNIILIGNLRKINIDVIHFPYPYGMCRKSGLKQVVTIHDLTPVLYPKTHNWMNVLFHRFILPLVLDKTQYIIVPSENTGNDLRIYFNIQDEKIRVVHNGIDDRFSVLEGQVVEDFRKKAGLPDRFILSVSTLEPRKNYKVLLEAFSSIKRTGREDVKLVIAGKKGWKFKEIFRMVMKLGLKDDVVFAGHIENEILPYYYCAAELFVYPSMYEGFGLPPLEAMACGTPVIASDNSALRELFHDAALLLDPRNYENLADGIKKLLYDKNMAKELSEKGRSKASRFSWEKTARETHMVYEEAAQS